MRHLRDHCDGAIGHCADEIDGEPAVECAPAFVVDDVLRGTNDSGYRRMRDAMDERLAQRL